MKNSFYLLSLGCPKNLVDSEKLTRRLCLSGLRPTREAEEADTLIVNTCGFIEAARKESIDEILGLAKLKGGKRRLLVFGCLSERYKEELQAALPEVDAMWGVNAEEEIARYMGTSADDASADDASADNTSADNTSADNTSADNTSADNTSADNTSAEARPSTFPYAYLKISEGCRRRCSFCSIPLIRGPLRNYSPETILKEAEDYIRSGTKELILVSQDTASYKVKGFTFSELLKDICSIPGDFWVRVHYLHPSGVDDSILEAMAGEPKVARYLDMPLQHSEQRILRLMSRGGGRRDFTKIINRARKMMPGLAVRTTFIVGFPGESEEEFEGVLDFIEETGFEHAGAFVYSKEEGTGAARLPGQLPKAVKKRRWERFMRAQAAISLEKNKSLIGRGMTALVDETDGKFAIGRLASQAPDVDGVVFIEDEKGALKPGDFARVLVTEAQDYDLRGLSLSLKPAAQG
ncbi:MAG: 30S ribosomal protein S12 methylthiotransferase RimO [Nitrospiraceae bacterium]|nr:30S ribosomal protein S12 methylthiotransferase RimO [Nitrospiraceae bacterium]